MSKHNWLIIFFALSFQHTYSEPALPHTMQNLLTSGFCEMPEKQRENEIFNSRENCPAERREFMLVACDAKDSYLQAINLRTSILKASLKPKVINNGRLLNLSNGYSLVLPRKYAPKVRIQGKYIHIELKNVQAELTLNELGQIDLVGFTKAYKMMQLSAKNNFDALAEMLSRNIDIDPREASCVDLYAVRQVYLQKSILQFNGNYWRFFPDEKIVFVTGAEQLLVLKYFSGDKALWLYAKGHIPEDILLAIAKSIRPSNAP